jgi:hypothetical protein
VFGLAIVLIGLEDDGVTLQDEQTSDTLAV